MTKGGLLTEAQAPDSHILCSHAPLHPSLAFLGASLTPAPPPCQLKTRDTHNTQQAKLQNSCADPCAPLLPAGPRCETMRLTTFEAGPTLISDTGRRHRVQEMRIAGRAQMREWHRIVVLRSCLKTLFPGIAKLEASRTCTLEACATGVAQASGLRVLAASCRQFRVFKQALRSEKTKP